MQTVTYSVKDKGSLFLGSKKLINDNFLVSS